MGIRLATFQQHQLTAQDYALLCAKSVSSGIFYGCNVTIKDESTLHVTSGVGIANGRTFDVTDDDYPVELTGGGSMVGRIYVHVDLADVDTPAQILVVKGATLPALVQDADMNESTGVWDLELATFDVDASEISNLVYTASGVSGGGGGTMLAPYYDASEAWLKDQIFQKDGVLYKCLTDIAVGAPLVVGTNVKVTDFAEETEALNQNLTINLEDTSVPSSTTFNELIEMMAEKLFPKVISLFKNGTFIGQYTTNPTIATYATASQPSVSSDAIRFTVPPGNTGSNKATAILFKTRVNLDDFSKIKLASSLGTFEKNISGQSYGEKYVSVVCVGNAYSNAHGVYIVLGDSDTSITWGQEYMMVDAGNASSFTITEVTLEP